MAAGPPPVVIEGADEVARALRAIGDKGLQSMLREANKKSAAVVVRKALPHVPVGKTGRLKASLRASGSQKAGDARAGGAKVRYAAAIHYGRGSGNVNFKHGQKAKAQRGGPIKGRPFLWNAAASSVSEVTAVYANEMNRMLASMMSQSR